MKKMVNIEQSTFKTHDDVVNVVEISTDEAYVRIVSASGCSDENVMAADIHKLIMDTGCYIPMSVCCMVANNVIHTKYENNSH